MDKIEIIKSIRETGKVNYEPGDSETEKNIQDLIDMGKIEKDGDFFIEKFPYLDQDN